MATNKAAWVCSKDLPPAVGPADIPTPGPGEIVVKARAVPLHPGDWKVLKGIIPIPLNYPTVIGNYVAGEIYSTGEGVTRFKPSDRVLTTTCFSLLNFHKYGAYQRFVLSNEDMTSHIPPTLSFTHATSASQVYASMSAVILHLGLDRPSSNPIPKDEKILIWGGGSSFGFFCVQIAVQAGYQVYTTASPTSTSALKSIGAAEVLDYHSSTIEKDLRALGPFQSIFAAQDSAADQVIIGSLLAAQGGGSFISTMGLRPGVILPEGVTCTFVQYMDDYLLLQNSSFKSWLFTDYLPNSLVNSTLKLGDVEVIGGLSMVAEGLERLQRGEARGVKLVVRPDLD